MPRYYRRRRTYRRRRGSSKRRFGRTNRRRRRSRNDANNSVSLKLTKTVSIIWPATPSNQFVHFTIAASNPEQIISQYGASFGAVPLEGWPAYRDLYEKYRVNGISVKWMPITLNGTTTNNQTPAGGGGFSSTPAVYANFPVACTNDWDYAYLPASPIDVDFRSFSAMMNYSNTRVKTVSRGFKAYWKMPKVTVNTQTAEAGTWADTGFAVQNNVGVINFVTPTVNPSAELQPGMILGYVFIKYYITLKDRKFSGID